MTTLREAAQMALDALEAEAIPTTYWEQTITALRAALAQPEQEPVAWMHTTATGDVYFRKKPHDKVFNPQPVYIAPPQREWQGLTDKEYEAMAEKYVTNCYFDTLKYARAIEAKLKEKNNG